MAPKLAAAAPPPPTPSPTVAPAIPPITDPAELWPRVLQAVAQRPSLSWVQRSVSLEHVSGNVVRLGQRANMRFITPSQKLQLEELIGSLLGRRVALEFSAAAPTAAPPEPAPRTAQRSDYTASHRDAAMNLPLVKQVLETFNDATLLNVRPQAQADAEQQSQAPDEDVPAARDSGDDESFDAQEFDADV